MQNNESSEISSYYKSFCINCSKHFILCIIIAVIIITHVPPSVFNSTMKQLTTLNLEAYVDEPTCCSETKYENWKQCNNSAFLDKNFLHSNCLLCISYQCLDWTVGSILMQQRQKRFLSRTGIDVYFGIGAYGNDPARTGLCYRLSVEGIEKNLIVQVTNQGPDVPVNNFDLMMGAGGFGLYNGCTKEGSSVPQYPGSTRSWGSTYGGIRSKADCMNLPQYPYCSNNVTESYLDNLQDLCQWTFINNFRHPRLGNPKIQSVCEVACPLELVDATHLHRSDEKNLKYYCTTSRTEIKKNKGMLTSMMDCAKPSYAWENLVPYPTFKGYEALIPCRRDGYVRINEMVK